jgi:uncharacterized membrane protein YgcG
MTENLIRKAKRKAKIGFLELSLLAGLTFGVGCAHIGNVRTRGNPADFKYPSETFELDLTKYSLLTNKQVGGVILDIKGDDYEIVPSGNPGSFAKAYRLQKFEKQENIEKIMKIYDDYHFDLDKGLYAIVATVPCNNPEGFAEAVIALYAAEQDKIVTVKQNKDIPNMYEISLGDRPKQKNVYVNINVETPQDYGGYLGGFGGFGGGGGGGGGGPTQGSGQSGRGGASGAQ